MIPQLTEPWAAHYLEAIVTLFVFALGLPGVIFELAIPHELIVIIHENGWVRRRILVLMVLPYILVSLLFIWALHPSPEFVSSGVDELVAAFLITGLLFYSVVPWVYVGRVSTSRRVTRKLGRKIKKHIARNGQVLTKCLVSLGYIGSHATQGKDKDEVISELIAIANFFGLTHERTGNDLRETIVELEHVVLGGHEVGGDENFCRVASFLEDMVHRLHSAKLYRTPDEAAAERSLQRLTLYALENLRAPSILLLIQACSFSSLDLLIVGKKACERKQFDFSLHSLRKLEKLVEDDHKIRPIANYSFTLLAMSLLQADHPGLRERVNRAIKKHFVNEETEIFASFSAAIQYFESIGRFDLTYGYKIEVAAT